MYEIYTVKEQDTLDKIAEEYGTTVGVLVQIKGFGQDDVLLPGNRIVVPVMRKQPYQYYTVKKGDNMYEIAKKNNIDYHLLLQLNGLDKDDYIYPNQTIMLPSKGLKVYLTQNDDTLDSILNKMNVSLDELMKENNKIYLRPEQILIFREK
ncbi:MAG: LysM peptidoglycan-binding domain-containing protein [Erysipelotrichaceae bacterium]|nr:LysM peptidoglycan-binding domain-containing protein [Erysipelotrichaceae bacterium]